MLSRHSTNTASLWLVKSRRTYCLSVQESRGQPVQASSRAMAPVRRGKGTTDGACASLAAHAPSSQPAHATAPPLALFHHGRSAHARQENAAIGDVHLWSPSSNVLAVEEWLTIDYAEGPITALVLIDLHHRREAQVARVTNGFVVLEAFEGSTIAYRAEFAGQGVVQHFKMDTEKIKEWITFA